ncbi:MAG TPA: zf-HC2 domain-containing protein [Candidatus Limnocylindria bacterium]
MRLFSVACRAAEQKMAALFTGELHPRERLELEAHADVCARCDAALRDLTTISFALDRAYAPLRARGTLLSPARVRLAARVEPRSTVPWWRTGFVGRLSEATMALGFAALVLGGALDLGVKPAPEVVPSVTAPSVIKGYFKTQPPVDESAYARWLRFQLRVIGGPVVPAVRYPVGGQFDVAQYSTEDDWLSAGAPR